MLKVCLVGSKRHYPAFNSVSSILRDTLGKNQVIELRIKDWLPGSPSVLKVLLKVFQDLILNVRVLSCYKKEAINILFLFQVYYPMSLIMSKLLNLKSIIFIGGSDFHWSYVEHTSTMGRVLAYANLPIRKICHEFADALITLSENMVEITGLKKYDYKTWFALPRLDKEFFKEFRISKNYEHRSVVLGFVGSLYRRKGVLNFIQAIPLITKERDDCKFLLVGGGPLLEIVRSQRDELEIRESLEILGFVDYGDLKNHYNEMKLSILPAYAEGIPSTIFEAMACGTPVLATPVGSIADVIKDGQTGFLLESTDPKYIAYRITRLLENPKLLKTVSENAYEYIRENLREEKVLESWRRIFENLVVPPYQKSED